MSSLLGLLCGCASPHVEPASSTRRFDFSKDTFAYPNELTWEYFYDSKGKWTTKWRHPKPEYSHHCFVMARSTRQFFFNAQFCPEQPPADERTYRRLIQRVMTSSPRYPLPDSERIDIPGYENLRDFSRCQEKLLKQECGGAWQSYFQRGHWRMLFPFTRRPQRNMAEQLLLHLKQHSLAMVHLVRFPRLLINHAVIIFDAKETETEIRFTCYDPNDPANPRMLTYERAARSFFLPPNNYYPGGHLDVYEVDHKWNY